jgi:hypothetical protein
MAQLNFAVITCDARGNPIGGLRLTATPSDVGAPQTTGEDGITLWGRDGISAAGPYPYEITLSDPVWTAPPLNITVGIGNDTGSNPPYLMVVSGGVDPGPPTPAPPLSPPDSAIVSVPLSAGDWRALLSAVSIGGLPPEDVAKHFASAITNALNAIEE